MTRCWFEGRPLPGGRCWGPLQKAHLIPKQRLRRELPERCPELVTRHGLEGLIWDPRVWIPVCFLHHQQFDFGRLRLVRADLPPAVEEFARETGMEWSLARDYGEAVTDG